MTDDTMPLLDALLKRGGGDFMKELAEEVLSRLGTPQNAFAKLKALLRTAAARTVMDLRVAIREAFTRFTPDECRNYLAAAGYDAYDPT